MPRTKKNANSISLQENINLDESISEINTTSNQNELSVDNIINNPEVVQKSKRGRKPKKQLTMVSYEVVTNSVINENIILSQNEESVIEQVENPTTTVIKKRVRKTKGGKIIAQISPLYEFKETKPNVILHLKCSIKDLQNNLFNNNNNINGYNLLTNNNELSYQIISDSDLNLINNYEKPTNSIQCQNIITNNVFKNSEQYEEEYLQNINSETYSNDQESQKPNEIKDIWRKLKILQHNLHVNNISDKKSACFWCTCDFDNPPIYIPKYYFKNTYHVYGCFCSPECATAFLMEENVDSSTRFERYHLLNHIYSKIYDYKKNIKPAPDPYYMLDKFYGNLSIQDYRSLLKNERLFLVVDKPLTRILPELHEENDDFIINNKIIPSNTYQMKKKVLQKQTKSTILNEKFGLHI
jgi:hypothetical protein